MSNSCLISMGRRNCLELDSGDGYTHCVFAKMSLNCLLLND